MTDIPDIKRWTYQRKTWLVEERIAGRISREQCLERGITDEEYGYWVRAYLRGGKRALRIAAIQPPRLGNSRVGDDYRNQR